MIDVALCFDVAGSENYALASPAILEALTECTRLGVPMTAHAGELPRGMVPNLETALDAGVRRIGHGMGLCFGDAVASGAAESLLARAAAAGVSVEVCLTGIITPSRVPAYAQHPIARMLAAGVRPSLSCDNLTLSGDDAIVGRGAYPVEEGYIYCHPSGEIAHAVVDCGLAWAQVRQLLLNGLRASFSAPPEALVREYEAAIADVLGR